jgi:sulfur transfer complex TusBCD TusB component (DsrH family)
MGRGSRSFAAIPDKYQEMTRIAAKVVAAYTLYQKPLLTPGETLLLIQNAWHRAQLHNRYVEKVKEVDNYVSLEHSDKTRRITDVSSLKVSIVERGVIS